MKKFFNPLLSDKILSWSTYAGMFFILVGAWCIAFFYGSLPPFLPIYNKMAWGYARIGSKIELLFPLGLAISLLILNTILSISIYKRVPLLARLIAATNVGISLITTIFIAQVILLVR